MAATACVSATRKEEHAVSMDSAGPVKLYMCEMEACCYIGHIAYHSVRMNSLSKTPVYIINNQIEVCAWVNPYIHTHITLILMIHKHTCILQRLMSNFQQLPMLRIHKCSLFQTGFQRTHDQTYPVASVPQSSHPNRVAWNVLHALS